jgi:hypothetical protein
MFSSTISDTPARVPGCFEIEWLADLRRECLLRGRRIQSQRPAGERFSIDASQRKVGVGHRRTVPPAP